MSKLLKRLHKEECGQDLIEYALILALMAMAIVASMSSLARAISSEFAKISGILT